MDQHKLFPFFHSGSYPAPTLPSVTLPWSTDWSLTRALWLEYRAVTTTSWTSTWHRANATQRHQLSFSQGKKGETGKHQGSPAKRLFCGGVIPFSLVVEFKIWQTTCFNVLRIKFHPSIIHVPSMNGWTNFNLLKYQCMKSIIVATFWDVISSLCSKSRTNRSVNSSSVHFIS